MRNLIWLLFLGFFVVGCSTQKIIEKAEYAPSIQALEADNISIALKKFPKKETTHFIPLLEKVYLQLINDVDVIKSDSPDTFEFKNLLAQSREIEQNEKTSVSNEIDQLFFIRTDEGYYPANHEIFWMHLLLGLTFVKKGKIDKARVEAKRISELFARIDMSGKPFYDNDGLRVLSAALWALCGEKESAIVDLRKAKEIGKFPFLKKSEDMPLDWELIFKGTGFVPEPKFKSFSDKLSGFKALEFQSLVSTKEIFKEKELISKYVFSSLKWHSENLIRNESFKETIQKSKYMSRMFKSEFEYQSLNVLTTAATGLVVTTGIALGVGIVGGGIYLLTQSNSSEGIGEIFAFGILVGSKIYEAGISFYDSTQSKIQTERKDFQDISRFYRYVRFIPDYFILETDPKPNANRPAPFLQLENSNGKIKLFFEP